MFSAGWATWRASERRCVAGSMRRDDSVTRAWRASCRRDWRNWASPNARDLSLHALAAQRCVESGRDLDAALDPAPVATSESLAADSERRASSEYTLRGFHSIQPCM